MSAIEEQGFEIIHDAVDHRTLSEVGDALSDASLQHSRAGMRNALRVEAVRILAHDTTLMKFASSRLSRDALPFRVTLFDKSPRSNWLVVWHQDTALPLKERRESHGWGPWSVKEGMIYAHAPASALEQVLAIRVHLDDSNTENGPLRVLPGTHRNGVLSDDAIHHLTSRVNAVDCCLPAGGVLLMRPLLVHASSKVSAKAEPRRVLHIEYSSCRIFPGGVEIAVCG